MRTRLERWERNARERYETYEKIMWLKTKDERLLLIATQAQDDAAFYYSRLIEWRLNQ